jgi:hypothetical protein
MVEEKGKLAVEIRILSLRGGNSVKGIKLDATSAPLVLS